MSIAFRRKEHEKHEFVAIVTHNQCELIIHNDNVGNRKHILEFASLYIIFLYRFQYFSIYPVINVFELWMYSF